MLRSSSTRALCALLILGSGSLVGCHPKRSAEASASPSPTPSGYQVQRLTPQEVQGLRTDGEQVLIVDVRAQPAYETEHIEGAINVPWRKFAQGKTQFPRDRFLLFYCTCPDDHSSVKAVSKLHDEQHFTRLAALRGGLAAWREAGLPVTKKSLLSARASEPKALYTNYCMTCHQADGLGITNIFPPLAGNAVVQAAAPEPAIRAVLGGMQGVPVGGKGYEGTMPAYRDTLSDAEIAAVLTYVREQWGAGAGPVTPQAVHAFR